jgi:dTDP-4-dehydrorhamnose 3,5-epimerase
MSGIDLINFEGVKLVRAFSESDSRGKFVKVIPDDLLLEKLSSVAISVNPKVGTIRGLHLQVEPYAEEKVISCVQGSTYEVIVDIRPNSKTFGRFATFELSSENSLQVYLPKGIAHGFQTLMPETIIHYIITSQYSLESSYTINPLGSLDIQWPIREFTISEKDLNGMPMEFVAQKYAESLNSKF